MDIQKILTSDVVDLSTIKQYFSSDKDSLIQLVDVYLSDTASKIDILEESLTKVDYESVKSICHYLKSSFGLMGVNCLNEITTLEKKSQNNEPEKVIKEKLNFVIPICRESITEYRLILDGLEAL
jgi:HPt (histidine-containing phosphotransfer) domain-containing protein